LIPERPWFQNAENSDQAAVSIQEVAAGADEQAKKC